MTSGAPVWLPASKVEPGDITPVAWFVYDFNLLAARFGARISVDREGGGRGLVRHFFLSLGGGAIAAFSAWDHKPGMVELSLEVDEDGAVKLDDFEAAMGPLNLPMEEVRRQGAFTWLTSTR